MKVYELIEHLERYNPMIEVYLENPEANKHDELLLCESMGAMEHNKMDILILGPYIPDRE